MTKLFAAVAVLAAFFVWPVYASGADDQDGYFEKTDRADQAPQANWSALFGVRPKAKPKYLDIDYSRAWIDRQPKATGNEQWQCLSEALYFETRGETVKGQFAVAEVIMNRVKSTHFPNTLCGVIKQGTGKRYQCQFTYTCDGHAEVIAEPEAFERAAKVASSIIDGVAGNLTNGATHYHTTAVRPAWARVYTHTASIGVHRFYRHNYRTASN